MGSRNIFLYWVGNEYKLIILLRKLIYLHSRNGKGYNVILLNNQNIHEYIQYIPDYFCNLCYAHQADFVRVNVICDYGGIWLDSDTLVIDSLDSLFDTIENKNGFFIKQNNKNLWNGIFGSKKQTPLMIEWKRKMIEVLDIKQNTITWSEIGNNMLDNFSYQNSLLFDNYEVFNGLDNLYPVNYDVCLDEFIHKPYDNYKNIIREYQPLIVLVSCVYRSIEKFNNDEEILNADMPLNYFINKSLENLKLSRHSLFELS
jgi:hypothetical protein